MTLAELRAILHRHEGLYVRAYVYGSVARGEEDRYSDVDLVLVRRTGADFFDRIREVMAMVRDLGPVDLLIYTPEEIEQLVAERASGFLAEIMAKGVEIEGLQGRGAALAAPG